MKRLLISLWMALASAKENEIRKRVPCWSIYITRNGDLAFDFAGCLECGTCRVLCGETIVKLGNIRVTLRALEFRQGECMEVLVCISQVPDTSEIKLDPETNNLIRTGLPSIVNPDDMHALEAALAVDENEGSRVTVLAMGPPQAEDALRECLSLVLMMRYLLQTVLSAVLIHWLQAIRLPLPFVMSKTMNRQFEIIFCGKQAIDGDTRTSRPSNCRRTRYGASMLVNLL